MVPSRRKARVMGTGEVPINDIDNSQTRYISNTRQQAWEMARKKREWYEGASYHIMARGNRKGKIFLDKDDYYIFLKILRRAQEKVPFDLHAYCLMTNHFHLELTTGDRPIGNLMQRLLQNYTKWFNAKYGLVGHLFGSRYTDCMIRDERYFLEVSRYIHLNPVKAGIVDNPLDYAFSSYRHYVIGGSKPNGGPESGQAGGMNFGPESGLVSGANSERSKQVCVRDEGLEIHYGRIMDSFTGDRKAKYRMFVEEKMSHEKHEARIMEDIRENELWLPE